MTNARHKLNHYSIVGSITIALAFAIITGSPLIFIVVTALLIASSVLNGEIRMNSSKHR